MNIGFDLDKIFINHSIPNTIINKFYKQKRNGTLLYRIPSRGEQLLRLITHHSLFRPPIKKNILFIEDLAKKNTNKHYLVSGRFGFQKEKTDSLIHNYNFDKIFDGLYFNYENIQPHVFKDMVIKSLKLDKYVDDDFDLLEYLALQNPTTNFFWFNNKRTGEIKPNLVAITELEQIFQ